MKTAIVTIAIGAAYSARFRAHSEPGWSRYADRHGFKLLVIKGPLSFELQKHDLLHVLDSRFNALLIFLIMQMQMQLRRSLMPGECAALVRSVFDQGYFLHLAGLKDSVNEFLAHLPE